MSVGEPAVTATSAPDCEFSHRTGKHPATAKLTYECKLKHNRQTDVALCDYHATDLRAGRILCLTENKPLVVLEDTPL